MGKQTQRGRLIIAAHQIYRDASLSAHQRQEQANDLQRRIIALQIDRGVDPVALAAAMVEQGARTQLAGQAIHNIASRGTLKPR